MSRELVGIYDFQRQADDASLRRALAGLGEAGPTWHLAAGPVTIASTGDPVVDAGTCPYICLVDGVIDNFEAIASEIGMDAPLEPTLAEGYARSGPEFLARLRGRFALVVLDRDGGEVVLAVDQLGSRALFTIAQNGCFFWASEIRNLLEVLPRRPAPDPLGVTAWLAFAPLPPEVTLYEGMQRIPGGHFVSIRGGRSQLRRYWSPHYVRPRRLDPQELATTLRTEVSHAVGRQAPAGYTGVLMSGGLDSTAIAGVAKLVGAQPRAYSAIFPGRAEVDESALLEEVTDYLDIPWTRLVVERGSALKDMLKYQLAWQVPSPSANLYFLGGLARQAAADGVEVLLDGEGGDELFGCVPYLIADRVRRGRFVDAFRLVGKLPWGENDPPWRGVRSFFVDFGLKGAMPHRAHEISRALRRKRLSGPDWLSAENRRLLWEVRDPWPWKRSGGPRWWNFLVDVLTVGRERIGYHDFLRRKSALAGLEGGHPFLDDLQLIELMLQLRPEPMFDRRYSRPVLRDALAGILPDVVRLRPQKANFTRTVADCFAGLDRAHATRLLTEKGSEIAAFVVPGAAEGVLEKLTDPRYPYYATAITRMVALECWLRSQSDPDFPRRLLERDLSSPQYRIVSPPRAAVAKGMTSAGGS